ncbi:MAG: hypothetical protein CR997_10270 [Acidobacteria bacterium]|nr:MAG: hypothetical protein CR997_10270 [Acidobacteriota bacterium]
MTSHFLSGYPKDLQWSDFTSKETPPVKGYTAFTYTTYTETRRVVKKSEDGDYFLCTKLTIAVNVDKAKSWVLKSAKSKELLKHEQGHFDIVGIAAKHVLEIISSEQAETKAGLYKKIQKAYRKAQKMIDNINESYDTETDHGLDTGNQILWNERLAKWKKNGLSWQIK